MSAELNAYQLRKWSVKVRWRDRVCQICGSREKLQAHHIWSKSYYPELAYDLDNGVALCGDDEKDGNRCHHTFHILYMLGYRKKCNGDDWNRFNQIVNWSSEAVKSS